MLQVMIDHRAEILQRILVEVPQCIEQIFKEIESEISTIAQAEAGDDVEMRLSIQHSLDEMYRCDDKPYMIELINKALIVMTDSYCESALKEIAKEKKVKSAKMRGDTDIEKLLRKFIDEPKSNVVSFLDKYWPDFIEFHDSRNNIVHEDKIRKGNLVDTEYIAHNIESVRHLLRAVDELVPQ